MLIKNKTMQTRVLSCMSFPKYSFSSSEMLGFNNDIQTGIDSHLVNEELFHLRINKPNKQLDLMFIQILKPCYKNLVKFSVFLKSTRNSHNGAIA